MQTEDESDLQKDVTNAKFSKAPVWMLASGLIVFGIIAVCSQFVGLKMLLTFYEIKTSWELTVSSEQAKFNEMKKQRAILQDELSENSKRFSEKQVELKSIDSDLIVKNADLAGVQKQLELVRPLRDQAVAEQSKSNEQVTANESKLTDFKNSIAKIENDKRQNEIECQKLESEKIKLESDKQQLLLAVNASEQTLKNTTEKIDKIVKEDLQLNNTTSAIQKLQQEKLNLESELAGRNNQLEIAKTGIVEIDAKYKQIESKLNDYTQQIEGKQIQIATLSSQLEPLKKEKLQIENDLAVQNIRLDSDLATKNGQLEILKTNFLSIEAQSKQMEIKLKDFNQQLDDKQKDFAVLPSQIEPLKKEKLQLEKELAELNQQLIINQQKIIRLKIQDSVINEVQKWLMNLPPVKTEKSITTTSDSNALEKK